MNVLKVIVALALVVGLSACSSKFKTYNGPEVTRVVVLKERRIMQLYHHDKVLEQYDIDLGFAPTGDKVIKGDGKTPEGRYFIDRRNPNSRFHLSVGISYPNEADRAYARAHGQSPGGDIFIHGTPGMYVGEKDWTWGCIAVSNDEMEDVYAMVHTGTPVVIYP